MQTYTNFYYYSILFCIVDPDSKVVSMVTKSDLENLASWFHQTDENTFEIGVTGNEGVQLYYDTHNE